MIESKIDLLHPDLETYVFSKIEGNPQMVRFNYDIEAENVEGQGVISLGSLIYAPYKFISSMVAESNAYLI